MEHERYIEMMSAALDGELSPAERRELDAHLAECPECATLFRELSDQSAALRSLDCDVPADLRDRIMGELPAQEAQAPIRELKNRPRTETGGPAWRRWAGIAACAALVIAIGGAAALHGMGMSSGPDPRGANAPSTGEPMLIAETPGDLSTPRAPVVSTAAMPIAETPGSLTLEPDHYAFENEQIIRVCWGATPEAPSARIIGGADSLSDFLGQFPMDDLSALAEGYGAEFFEANQLLAVVVEAGSGSVRFSLAGMTGSQAEIRRVIPEVGTCDMAAWLILAEVAPMFEDGHTFEVVFTN